VARSNGDREAAISRVSYCCGAPANVRTVTKLLLKLAQLFITYTFIV